MKIMHKQSANNRRKLLSFALGIGVISGSVVQATVIDNTTVDYGPATYPYTSPYNPNPAGNVLAGLTPTASAGNFTAAGGSGGLARLTDTLYPTVADGNDLAAWATAGDTLESFVTYSLDLSGAPLGYNIDSIITLGGWVNLGRDQQLYTVYYSTVAAPTTFLQIGDTISYNPPYASPDDPRSTQVTIFDDTIVSLATGVAALRFNFAPPDGPSGTENGWTGYAELIALGSPTPAPEPSVALLLGLGGLLLWRQWKTRE